MRRIQLSGNSVALDADGLGNNVTGATFTLTANDAGDSLAHKITVLNNTATDHSAKTLALVGTDADGNPLTETMAAPGTSTSVTSTKYFKTLTSITPSATIGADTFDIGWAADSVSTTYRVPNALVPQFNLGFGCTVVSGSPTYTVQHTYDGVAWFNHASVAAETAAADGAYTSPIAAMRLLWTAAGSVTLTGFQVGI